MNFLKLNLNNLKSIPAKLILVGISVILLTIPWTYGAFFTILFAITPLLIIEINSSRKEFFLYSTLTIILWHMLSVMWIAKAAEIGVYASTGLNIILWNIAFQSYSYARRNHGKALAYVLLVSGFLCVEYLNLQNEEISWPWLVLGYSLANSHTYAQWYEFTGSLGGSLWILITNILFFEFLDTRKRKYLISAISIVVIGIVVSKIMYHTYTTEGAETVKVGIVQPNFDPYNQKFVMGKARQIEIVDSLMQTLPHDLDFIITPETTFDESLNEDHVEYSSTIRLLKNRLKTDFPKADLILGSTTYITYNSKVKPTPTARPQGNKSNGYYDLANSSLSINPNREVEIYKKSKLVIGAEMVPFSRAIPALGELSLQLGGSSGVLLPQQSPTIFEQTALGTKFGAIICYESVYGEHYAEFANKGAEVMFIITNDGWWGDTYGHKQHFSFSRLRAIETRKAIGRSANTGISALISPTGDIIKSLGWWKEGTISGELTLNSEKTIYATHGDYLGVLGSFVFVLMLLYSISLKYKKKLMSNQ